MSAGSHKIDRYAGQPDRRGRPALGSVLLADFLETASLVDTGANPLLQRLARREIARLTQFVRQLSAGGEIAYDGEDREWLIGLTNEAQHSIDAISPCTVNGGPRGFDGGLWTSDLGSRYLDLQGAAIARNVSIRRIFVVENEDLYGDGTFMQITQMQRDMGIDIRMLNFRLAPERLQAQVFDFAIFDGILAYEITPAATFTSDGRDDISPVVVRTRLTPEPYRVRQVKRQFEALWTGADPERQISR